MSGINDETINDLNAMMRTIEREISCDTDCQREKNIQSLRRKWKNSEKTLNNLPDVVLENEKKYYIAKYGRNYYENNILEERYRKHIEDWRNNELDKFDEINKQMETTLDNYKSETIAKSRMIQLFKEVKNKNESLKKDIDDYYKLTFTSERRVWYEKENKDNLLAWRFYIKIFYFTVILAYVFMGPFLQDGGYKSWKMWLFIIFYVALPFILHYIVSFFINLYSFLEKS